ncbi:hypothetical protein GOV03_03325 [Candidatus Woesearchaeota archaeon]|nr:hypothetical protein [Candidatus Woesearchaeota archaeon]
MTKKDKKKNEEEEEVKAFPAEEQGILPKETSEEISEDMASGEKEADVYSEEGRKDLAEDGEIENWEEGFMEGASGGGQLGKDALTGEPLMGAETVELLIDGKKYRFVNSENAEKFRQKKEAEKF